MVYWELFVSFLKIGLFSIGGGMAAIPLIQDQIVDLHGWLSLGEFTDLITIAEMTPGPIAINSATFVGHQVGGIYGAIIATLGCIIPSTIIVMTLGLAYNKFKNLSLMQGVLSGVRPAIVALIASAGITIAQLAFWGEAQTTKSIENINFVAVGLFVASLVAIRKFKINPIIVMAGCGIIGTILELFVFA